MTDINQSIGKLDEDKKKKKSLAEHYTCSLSQTAHTLANLADGKTDPLSVLESLIDRMRALNKGPKGSELILKTNAIILDTLFHKMINNGYDAPTIEIMQTTLNLAMRAQNQLRKTVLALEQVKNPPQKTFVAQQNLAQIQQVNNGLIQETDSAKILKSENKLDTINGNVNDPKSLDRHEENCTVSKDSRIADLVPVHRTTDS